MTPTRRRPQVGFVAAAGAVALAAVWSLVCPWLVALPSVQARQLVPFDLVGAVLVGLVGWRVTDSAVALGPRGAIRLGGVVTLVGAAVAFALGVGGLTICVGLIVMLVASWRIGRRRGDETHGRSVPLRGLMAGA